MISWYDMHSLWLIWYLWCLIFYIISYINCCKYAARQQYVRISRYNLGCPCLHGSTAVHVARRQVYLIIYAHSRKLASLNVKNRSASKINMQTDQVCRSIVCKQMISKMWSPTMWHFDKCRLYEPVQPPFKLRNSKWCLDSSLTVIEYSRD